MRCKHLVDRGELARLVEHHGGDKSRLPKGLNAAACVETIVAQIHSHGSIKASAELALTGLLTQARVDMIKVAAVPNYWKELGDKAEWRLHPHDLKFSVDAPAPRSLVAGEMDDWRDFVGVCVVVRRKRADGSVEDWHMVSGADIQDPERSYGGGHTAPHERSLRRCAGTRSQLPSSRDGLALTQSL